MESLGPHFKFNEGHIYYVLNVVRRLFTRHSTNTWVITTCTPDAVAQSLPLWVHNLVKNKP